MSKLIVIVKTEWIKIRKAKIFIFSIGAMCLLPIVCGIFLMILLHPEYAASTLLMQKAQLVGATDWASYFTLLNEMMSVGGIILFGFFASWIFGREYSDKTAKDLLALPMPRGFIVCSKYIALALWCLLLTVIALCVAVLFGLIINPPGFSLAVLFNGSGVFVISALLTIALTTPVAFFASFGKGYLSPVGFILFTILLGQLAELLGIGAYCPWAMPAIFAGIAHDTVSIVGYLLFVALVIFGGGATYFWWRYADQK